MTEITTREEIEKLIDGLFKRAICVHAGVEETVAQDLSLTMNLAGNVLRTLLRERDEAVAREAWTAKELYRLAQKSPREVGDSLAVIANQSSSRAAAMLDVVEVARVVLDTLIDAHGKPVGVVKDLADSFAALDGADNG